MPVRFVVVPQWQGSGSSRAMQLVTGAEAIRGDLPASATTTVDVPLEAGDAEGTGIQRFSSIRVTRQRYAAAVERVDDPLITIGGDCGVDYSGVARAAARRAPALLWFDAHADANDAAGSPSGAFHGMVLRSIVDDELVPASRVILAGTREFDPAEAEWIESSGITALTVGELADPSALVEAVARTGADSIYPHIDLDVLDPAEIRGVSFPEPFGLGVGELLAALRAVRAALPIAGAAVTEFSPAAADEAVDDLPTILRIVGALAS